MTCLKTRVISSHSESTKFVSIRLRPKKCKQGVSKIFKQFLKILCPSGPPGVRSHFARNVPSPLFNSRGHCTYASTMSPAHPVNIADNGSRAKSARILTE